jgi:thiaminase
MFQSWGVDLAKENKPDTATTKYTEFLLTTASGKGALKEYEKRKTGTTANKNKIASFTIAAMTPCMKLYSFLGQEISTTLNEGYHGSVYCDWIATYSSKSFQVFRKIVEHMHKMNILRKKCQHITNMLRI